MKKNFLLTSFCCLFTIFVVSQASATGFDFGNFGFNGPGWTLTDSDIDGFSEQLSLANAQVGNPVPAPDPIIGDKAGFGSYEVVAFSQPLTLDPANYVSGMSYDFNPMTYANGFTLIDDASNGIGTLLTADLTVTSLIVNGSAATASPFLELNLTNITAGAAYLNFVTNGNNSPIIDALLSSGGDITITMQLQSSDFAPEDGTSFSGSYSGSVSPVPEPTTILLSGLGLLGMGAYLRRRKTGKA